jgi:membrane fusion protein (multidrug efflux system)
MVYLEKKSNTVITALILTILLIIFLVTFKTYQIFSAIAAHADFQMPPDAVTTAIVQLEEWPEIYRAAATLKAKEGAVLTVESSGRVASTPAESGSRVQKGQLLVSLDVAVEEGELKSAEARVSLAKLEAERQRNLRKELANSKSDLDRAEAELLQATADYNRIKGLVDRRQVVAPFDGRVGVRMVNVGELVSTGEQIISLFGNNEMYVDFTIPQRYASRVQPGLKIEVRSDAYPEKVFSGQLTAVDSAVDASTRNITVRGELTNTDDQVGVLTGISAGDEIATSGVFKLRAGGVALINNEVIPGSDKSPQPENS